MRKEGKNTGSPGSLAQLADDLMGVSPPQWVFAVCYAAFVLLLFTAAMFHEPWFDEAQSWLIARDASYYDMLFVLPHYEGHPALWWLLLSVPARLGAPYELSLAVIMTAISSASAYLVMFRSPLPPPVRLAVPFTYFFFYQYGVVARPYGLFVLAFMLAAHFFGTRDKKPFAYVLSLMLLCASSAYGIIFSGTLAAVWCFRILAHCRREKSFAAFLRSGRFAALGLLLCFGVLLICQIMPYKNAAAGGIVNMARENFTSRLVYMTLHLPAECTLTGAGQTGQVTMCLAGAAVLLSVALCAYRGNVLLEFAVPWAAVTLFSASVYFLPHHMGLTAVFYLFILWISHGSGGREIPCYDILKPAGMFLLSLTVVIGIVWSIFSAVKDIRGNYFYSRDAARFIKENGLEECSIMGIWNCNDIGNGEMDSNVRLQFASAAVNAYFDENIFFNFNGGDSSKAYVTHAGISEQYNEEQYALWRETVPDVLVGEVHLEMVYDPEKVRKTDYILVKSVPFTQTFKMSGSENYVCIYMRRELLAEHYPDIKPENPADMEFLQEYIGG